MPKEYKMQRSQLKCSHIHLHTSSPPNLQTSFQNPVSLVRHDHVGTLHADRGIACIYNIGVFYTYTLPGPGDAFDDNICIFLAFFYLICSMQI